MNKHFFSLSLGITVTDVLASIHGVDEEQAYILSDGNLERDSILVMQK